jgi:hypothetical protein
VNSSSDGQYAALFSPSPKALQFSREIEQQVQEANAPPDRVEQAESRARRNPIVARIIIAAKILFFVVVFLISLRELVEWLAN